MLGCIVGCEVGTEVILLGPCVGVDVAAEAGFWLGCAVGLVGVWVGELVVVGEVGSVVGLGVGLTQSQGLALVSQMEVVALTEVELQTLPVVVWQQTGFLV